MKAVGFHRKKRYGKNTNLAGELYGKRLVFNCRKDSSPGIKDEAPSSCLRPIIDLFQFAQFQPGKVAAASESFQKILQSDICSDKGF